jgi:hypothetical protein
MKLSAKLNELPVPAAEHTDPNATELTRAWAAEGGLHVSLRRNWDGPDPWGIFLADLTRHAARIYWEEGRCSEPEALDRIFSMFKREWERPTDHGRTAAHGRKAH